MSDTATPNSPLVTAAANNAPLTGVSEAQPRHAPAASQPAQESTAQESTAQQVAPAPPVKEKVDEKFAGRLAVLTQKEVKAQKRIEAAAAKEAEVARREAAVAARDKQWEEAKTSPLKALAMLGLDYNQLTQIAINNGNIPPEVQMQQLMQRQEAFERRQQESEAARQALEVQQRQAYLQQQHMELQNTIQTECKEPQYPLIQFNGAQNDVYELIILTWQQQGRVLEVKDASKRVEDYLVAEAKKAAALLPQEKPPQVQQPALNVPPKQDPSRFQRKQSPTLTNANAPSLKPNNTGEHLTLEQVTARVLAKYQGGST